MKYITFIILVEAVLAALLSYILLRHGILATPDGWAYWEGSISLLENHRYTYLGGQAILGWPPLFSAYLALVQSLLGKSGFALAVAMCFITFSNTVAWLAFVYAYFKKCAMEIHSLNCWLGVSFTVLFMAYCSTVLLAQFLLLGFIGLMMFLLLRVRESSLPHYRFLVIALATTQAGALLTHNSGVMFVPAVILTLFLDTSRKIQHRLLASCCYALCGIAPYLGVRILLHQGQSHPSSQPLYGIVEYLLQSVSGLGQFFSTSSNHWAAVLLSAAIGLAMILFVASPFFSVKGSHYYTWRIPVLFAGVSYLCLLLLFNLTWIDSGLTGRFLYQVPLCLIPAVCVQLPKKPIWLFVVLSPLVLGAQVFRIFYYGKTGIVPPDRGLKPASNMIRAEYFLTGSTRHTNIPKEYVRISPPTYQWMARWNANEPAAFQQALKLEPD